MLQASRAGEAGCFRGPREPVSGAIEAVRRLDET